MNCNNPGNDKSETAKGVCSVRKCKKAAICKGLCSKHYQKYRRYGDPHAGRETFLLSGNTPDERFEERIGPADENGCQLWLAGKDSKGYGRLRWNGEQSRAHVVAYERANGPLPDGMGVYHLCGNKECVACSHLVARPIKKESLLETEKVETGEAANDSRIKHGLSDSREYKVWSAMLQRCNNTANPKWHLYGGRGIQVCERWLEFVNFYADMGPCPVGLTLDRIDNDGNYCAENCRWTTHTIQQRNKRKANRHDFVRLTFQGETKTLSEWSDVTGIPRKVLSNRRYLGWDAERILTYPWKPRSKRCQ